MATIETKDWIIVLATFLGPIFAVQAQKYSERIKESRNKKVSIFHTLMATRANRLSVEHVKALNMIDTEFGNKKGWFPNSDYQEVIDAWKNYYDHLSTPAGNNPNWSDRNDDFFIELLFKMSKALSYNFDKVTLRRRAYTPTAHGNQELENEIIRRKLVEVLSGESYLPVYFVNMDQNNNEEVTE